MDSFLGSLTVKTGCQAIPEDQGKERQDNQPVAERTAEEYS